MSLCFFFLLLVVCSYALTGLVRRYALARHLVDVPNQRSSHMLPTPRGGGVAVVVCYVGALIFAYSVGLISVKEFTSFIGAVCMTAFVGFIDDHRHVKAGWRLLAHSMAAAWGLYWLGGLPPLELLGVKCDLGVWGSFLAAIYLVWMLNLYNFMDGIDGLAAVEAITVCCSAVILSYLKMGELPILPLLLIASVLGFCVWNFPPAKIFMGDAGSGFLGVTLGLLSLQAGWVSGDLLWGWLIVLGVFIVDATLTLLRRMLRGDKVYLAHRSHAYQHAVRVYKAHLPITLAVAMINLFWLLPIAVAVVYKGLDGVAGLIIAYLPLVFLAFKYQAGQLESNGK